MRVYKDTKIADRYIYLFLLTSKKKKTWKKTSCCQSTNSWNFVTGLTKELIFFITYCYKILQIEQWVSSHCKCIVISLRWIYFKNVSRTLDCHIKSVMRKRVPGTFFVSGAKISWMLWYMCLLECINMFWILSLKPFIQYHCL